MSKLIRRLPWVASAAALAVAIPVSAQQLPPVPVPKENPVTTDKVSLGKALFWDEQLSSNNAVACGTCHQPRHGGIAARLFRQPGFDKKPRTKDDVFGAAGIVRKDEQKITRRTPLPFFQAQHAPALFWDGRAKGAFRDPLTGKVEIQKGGALESQALEPILNDTEMAHPGRSWDDVVSKLTKVKPLALASNLPKDVAAAIEKNPSYPTLFKAAFGDPEITPTRIAFAIASYERSLVADQTPYDKFVAGDPNAISMRQITGFHSFQKAGCAKCHTPPQFTDFSFRNIGLRPPREDRGRQEVTRNGQDRGKFKVPSLRNVGLRRRFMHNGQMRSLREAIVHYRRIGRGKKSDDNLDSVLDGGLYVQNTRDVIDFLSNALTDPRVKNETYPFDRPTLRSEQGKKIVKR